MKHKSPSGLRPRPQMKVTGLDEKSAKNVLIAFIIGTLAMSFMGVAAVLVKHAVVTGHWTPQMQESFVRLFDLDAEGNIPTWYSSILLFCAALLLTWNSLIARERRDRHWWAFVASVFLYLSVDEAAVIHEMAIKPIREIFHTQGFLYYGWIIPAGICVLIFGLVTFQFWLRLPFRIRLLFALSAVIYVGSALGIESIQGDFAEKYGASSWAYDWVGVIEESGEMFGVALFNYAVLLHAIIAQAASAGSRPDVLVQVERAAN
jgi:hypothetical protein